MDKRHIQKFKHHHMYMQIHTNKLLFPSHDDHVIGTCSSYQLNHKVDCIRTCPYDDGEQVEMFFLCTTPWNAIFTKSLWYLVNVIEQHIIYWFQNVPTPHQTSTWKVLELKTFSILMESYEQGQPTNHCMKAWTNTKFQIKKNYIHMDIALKPKRLNIGWLHYEVKKIIVYFGSKDCVNFNLVLHTTHFWKTWKLLLAR